MNTHTFFSYCVFGKNFAEHTHTFTHTYIYTSVDLLFLNGACENIKEKERKTLAIINIEEIRGVRKGKNERKE